MKNIAIIGMGKMGSKYAKMILEDESIGFKLVASTRIREKNLPNVKDYMGTFKVYNSDKELFEGFDKGEFKCDAVIVSTPHYSHKFAVIEAFKRKLDVLCEKPAGVYLKDGREMLEENNNNNVYGFIFHQRTYPINVFLKDIIDNNKYGKVKRISYIITDWFRTNAYYKSDYWRSTYKTDGGGVLLNQCPHSIDLLCHIFGMPNKVMAFCNEGKYHNVEVEDDVTSYLEWDSGVTGVFIASTGEIPGVNRMEITTDRAVIKVYKDKIEILSNEKNDEYYFNMPDESFKTDTKLETYDFVKNEAYKDVLKEFGKGKVVATGSDSLMSLYLSNAMYLSSWKKKIINIYDIGSKEELEFEKEFAEEMKKKI
ncbi:MAG: Gfo/Idh/MocA family oxidoreductase [Acholeplasmatales bacterium]|nr:Gfo/Idh/MocA family oxidoreductase [Acholeplasmatales bacterium]